MGILCEDFAFLESQFWHSFEQSVKQETMIACESGAITWSIETRIDKHSWKEK